MALRISVGLGLALMITAAALAGNNTPPVTVPLYGDAAVKTDCGTGTIEWDVSQNQDKTWHYSYGFSLDYKKNGVGDMWKPKNVFVDELYVQVGRCVTQADIQNLADTAALDDIDNFRFCCPDGDNLEFYGAGFIPIDVVTLKGDKSTCALDVDFDSPFAPVPGHFFADLQQGEIGVDGMVGKKPPCEEDICDVWLPTPGCEEPPPAPGVVPEPLTMLLVGGVLAPLALRLRRRICA